MALGLEGLLDLVHLVQHEVPLLVALVDRDHHHLDRGEGRREDEAVVVAVGHDQGAHQAGGHAPGGGPDVFLLAFLVRELDVERLCEVLAQEVGRTGLQGLAVLHHRLDGHRVDGAGETLARALVAHHHGQGHDVTGKAGVHVHHALLLRLGLLGGGVGGVALLPEELRGAEEQTGAHLPAHDVAPLVAQDGEVAPGMDPVLIGVPDDGFGSGADDELFLELRLRVHDDALAAGIVHQAVVRHHGALLRESGHVLGLAAEEGLGDEEREVGVLVSGFLEHAVENMLHLLPDGVSVGLDDHAAADGGLLGQVGLHHEVVVPLGVVLGPFRYLFCHNSIAFSIAFLKNCQ